MTTFGNMRHMISNSQIGVIYSINRCTEAIIVSSFSNILRAIFIANAFF